ncbi:MAG: YhjD/YihY/BrkB family envelope integrity protein, partial [Gammaproteobacteria bacterium]
AVQGLQRVFATATIMLKGVPKTPDYWLWEYTPKNRAGRFLQAAARWPYVLIRDAFAGQLMLRSASLVYTTMLSMVPLGAFAFTLMRGFGVFDRVEPLLFNVLAPLGNRGEELTKVIVDYIDQVDLGTLTLLGLAALSITVLLLFLQIEDNLNFIWRVKRSTNQIKRLAAYISLVFIGPLVVFIILAVAGSLDELTELGIITETLAKFEKFLPKVLVALIFSFFYHFFPDTKVRGSAALVGGLSAGLLWAAVGDLFAGYAANARQFTVLYSSFAIIVLALVWLYLSWIIFFLGAQISFYFQYPFFMRTGTRVTRIGNRRRERLALRIMRLIAADFRKGEIEWTPASLATCLGTPPDTLVFIVTRLETAGLLRRTEDNTLVPGKAIGDIDAGMILEAVRGGPDPIRASEVDPQTAAVIDEVEDAIGSIGRKVTLAELVGDQADERVE